MSTLSIALAILITVALMVEGAPPKRRADSSRSDESRAVRFLQQFGYLTGDLKQPRKPQATKSAIATYQKRSGLRATGLLTRDTLDQMAKPRCGVPDMSLEKGGNRFQLGDGKWTKLQLVYKIGEYQNSGDMTYYEIEQVMKTAFQMWSEVTDFTFRVFDPRVDVRPDIDIRFLAFTHGDYFYDVPFDGPGGVMGHSYFPPDGRVHFDASEQWTTGDGCNLLQVAVHEFGHALGLAHSDNNQSVMWTPFAFRPYFQLTYDDIQGVKMLYNGEYMDDNPLYPSGNVVPGSYKKSNHHQPQNSNQLQNPTFSQHPPKTSSQRRPETSSQLKHPMHGIATRFGGDDDDDDEKTVAKSTTNSTTTSTSTPVFVLPEPLNM